MRIKKISPFYPLKESINDLQNQITDLKSQVIEYESNYIIPQLIQN